MRRSPIACDRGIAKATPRIVIVVEDDNVHDIIEQPVEVLVLEDWLEGGPLRHPLWWERD
ncbi:hypothetical protein [Sulfobacillus harzensis]|uniref:Uncharacterized protein n=1 Tax=Sulfobacillus harzensis TaxID=2729629 RepID=A0A7Y0Q631_9FIRM|nr:hypothetical protein [Sulfobacillus harzensis]NMP24934.1 hypothetical protein [Sulfobacillus harzensis]